MTTKAVREVATLATAHRQREGAGFIVRRPISPHASRAADPFLMLDELGPIDYRPGEALGAPDHPHRGFETVSYILEGEVEHEDSAGHAGRIGPGDVQWMTAGAGIVHSEMPSRRIRSEGGRVHGFQIWVNLPREKKLTAPRYQEVPAAKIPSAASEDGRVRVKVIAGEALGARAVIDTHTPIILQDWTVEPEGEVTIAVPTDHRVLVYIFHGAARVGDQGTLVKDGQLAVLDAGDVVRLRAAEGAQEAARMLLFGGVPIKEPIVQYGPFVMNDDREIRQAIDDFQSGRMGEITRTATVARAT